MIQIKTFYFNPYRECTYVVVPQGKKNAIIVDPGMYGAREEQRLADYLHEHQLTPTTLLITHAHPDHVCGMDSLMKQYPDMRVYALESRLGGSDISALVAQEGVVEIEGVKVQLIPTPGHKSDSVCYYIAEESCLFTGDTLFQESIGRTDLPTGDMGQLCQSLKRLSALPKDTQVYPGHGYPTTIAHEKQYNPYL